MRRTITTGTLCCVAGVLLAACGGEGSPTGLCDGDMPPAGCRVACDPERPDDCGDGFYCEHGECVSDSECGIDVDLTPVIPIVILLIDQSYSMARDFGGGRTRWEAVEYALSDATDGALPRLDQQIEVGATLYTSENGDSGPSCPELDSVAPAPGNADAIGQLLLNNHPVDDTPTAEAVTAVTAGFPSDGDRPRILVLATDGNPDSCVDPDATDPQAARTASENAVAAAFAEGITTYVLSVGNDASATHLQHLANLGQGMPAASGTATAYVANDPQDLVDAFGAIVGGTRSCEIQVNGTVDLARAAAGRVLLDGIQLEFGTDWIMADAHTLELLGAACDEYLGSNPVMLSASFPCDGVEVE